jgi:hypothetical protein
VSENLQTFEDPQKTKPERRRFPAVLSGSRAHVLAITLVGLWILWFPAADRLHYEGKISGDSVLYFAYLQSVFEDGDIDFADDYLEIDPGIDESYLTPMPTGLAGNIFAPGAAVLWSPFYIAGKAFAGLSGVQERAGELRLLIAFVRFGTRLYTGLALLLLFLVARRFFNPGWSLLAVLGTLLCTPLYYYGLWSTVDSHALGAFAIALFLWICLKTGPERRLGEWALVGAAAGLAGLIRWADAAVLIWLAVEQWPRFFKAVRDREGAWRLLGRYALAAVIFSLILSPQFLVWHTLYGPFKTPLNFGANRVIWEKPEIVNVLFSNRHGLFNWHPALYLAFLGLFFLFRLDKRAALASILVFAAMLYLNSVTGDWWGGNAFGMRRFVSLSAVFALGLASIACCFERFFRRFPQTFPIGLLALFAWWNIELAGNYSVGNLPNDQVPGAESAPKLQQNLWYEKYGVPSSWPGSFLQSAETGWAPIPEADWIASTYLLYLQNSMNGEVFASYPSFRDGFSLPQSENGTAFRLLAGGRGKVLLSRITTEARLYMGLDALILRERLEDGQAPVIDVLLNGKRIWCLVGRGERTIEWRPLLLRGSDWKLGVNSLEFFLWVGREDGISRYLARGLDPENDTSLRPNEGHYALKVYRLKFVKGKYDRNDFQSVIPSGADESER